MQELETRTQEQTQQKPKLFNTLKDIVKKPMDTMQEKLKEKKRKIKRLKRS